MTYVKTTWIDDVTPVSAANLNKIEQGVADAHAGANIPLVTSLTPGVGGIPNPVTDGFRVNYLADDANGVVWPLRYRSASASAYKWENVGAATPLYLKVADEGISFGSGVWADTATPVRLTTPLAGDWMVTFSFAAYFSNMSNSNPVLQAGISVAGAAPSEAFNAGVGFTIPASEQVFPGRDPQRRVNGVASGTTIAIRFQWSGQVPPLVINRSLALVPVRVG